MWAWGRRRHAWSRCLEVVVNWAMEQGTHGNRIQMRAQKVCGAFFLNPNPHLHLTPAPAPQRRIRIMIKNKIRACPALWQPPRTGPKARPHTSLGQRPRKDGRDDPRAESPIYYTGIRAWNGPSALGSFSSTVLGRCPRLVWLRAVGPHRGFIAKVHDRL